MPCHLISRRGKKFAGVLAEFILYRVCAVVCGVTPLVCGLYGVSGALVGCVLVALYRVCAGAVVCAVWSV